MKDKIKIIFAVFIFIISLFFIFSQDASAQSCSDGSFRCSNNNQEKCVSGTWRLWNECVKIHPFGPYCGCSNNACVLCQT
ncbi:hypothetical protein HYT56_00005, partial [Candidatus Woesearchaeota archaeon]|nr:hypothetical protein [Candidatus Woesearchaeota archaeon]